MNHIEVIDIDGNVFDSREHNTMQIEFNDNGEPAYLTICVSEPKGIAYNLYSIKSIKVVKNEH